MKETRLAGQIMEAEFGEMFKEVERRLEVIQVEKEVDYKDEIMGILWMVDKLTGRIVSLEGGQRQELLRVMQYGKEKLKDEMKNFSDYEIKVDILCIADCTVDMIKHMVYVGDRLESFTETRLGELGEEMEEAVEKAAMFL